MSPAPLPGAAGEGDQNSPELSMGWVDPWVGLGWVTQNGPMYYPETA